MFLGLSNSWRLVDLRLQLMKFNATSEPTKEFQYNKNFIKIY